MKFNFDDLPPEKREKLFVDYIFFKPHDLEEHVRARILELLSDSKVPATRELVAGDKMCPQEVLAKLAEDNDVGVRYAVAENPNCPQSVRRAAEHLPPAGTPICWYAGSGTDFTPLILDLPDNPMRVRLTPTNQDDLVHLQVWMTDFNSSVWQFFDELRNYALSMPVPPAYPALWQRLGNYRVQINAVRTECLPDDDHRRRLREATLARLSNSDDPIAQQMVGANAAWDVMTLDVSVRGGRHNDRYQVWFSPFENEAFAEYLCLDRRFVLRAMVLIKVAGYGTTRPEFDNYGQDMWRAVRGFRHLRWVIADHRIGWPGFHPSGHRLEGWSYGVTEMYVRED